MPLHNCYGRPQPLLSRWLDLSGLRVVRVQTCEHRALWRPLGPEPQPAPRTALVEECAATGPPPWEPSGLGRCRPDTLLSVPQEFTDLGHRIDCLDLKGVCPGAEVTCGAGPAGSVAPSACCPEGAVEPELLGQPHSAHRRRVPQARSWTTRPVKPWRRSSRGCSSRLWTWNRRTWMKM